MRRTPFRFCMTSIASIAEFDVEAGNFKGLFSSPANMIFDMVKASINVTLIASDEPIKLINNQTGEYSGCFGKLQRGEADSAGFPLIMPVIDMVNITQLNKTGVDTGIYMLSPYTYTDSSQSLRTGALDQLSVISLEVWSYALISAVVFWGLMSSLKHLYDLKRAIGNFHPVEDDPLYGQSMTYQVITHMLQTETCDYLRFKERLVSILMSVLAFLFITFFLSMVTTDQVSTKPYFVYDTYERILGNKSIQALWLGYLSDHYFYRDAPLGSDQREIWEQSVTINEKYPERKSIIKCEPNEVVSIAPRARNQEIVVFLTHMFHDLFLSGMCVVIQGLPVVSDLRFKATRDDHLRPSYYVLPMSVHSGKEVEVLEWLCLTFIEMDLGSDPSVNSQLRDNIGKGLPKARFEKKFFECLQYEKLPEDEPQTLPLDLSNFRTLAYLYSGLISIASAVLLVEVLKRKPKRKLAHTIRFTTR